MTRDPGLTRIYGRWQKEIFADLAAVLLGGPAGVGPSFAPIRRHAR